MISLINDKLGFCSLFDKARQVECAVDYLEYFKPGFYEQMSSLVQQGGVIADGAYAYATKLAGIDACSVLQNFANMQFEQSFAGFNVAIYQGFFDQTIAELVQKSGAKSIHFERYRHESGYRYLGFDTAAAYIQASRIMLDAYDNGADFLLVNDAASFELFDAHAAKLQSVSKRDFSDFYVLTSAEFLALGAGKNPNSLHAHKLKVRLV